MGEGTVVSPARQTEVQRPRSFPSGEAFRAWLQKNRARKTELFVRCFRVAEKTRGLTYRGALDEALCFGWIDGVRGGLDGVSFSVRFTPRKPKSKWSIVNIRRAKELEREGRMDPSGAAAFKARTESGYSFESEERRLSRSFQREFRGHSRAWDYYQAQPPWYRRTCAFWVMSAKKEETRRRRLATLIASSERGEFVGPMKRPGR